MHGGSAPLMMCRVVQGTESPTSSDHGHPDPYWQPVAWLQACELTLEEEVWSWWCRFWPLTNGSNETARSLTQGLLAIWQWAMALWPAICLPAPSSLDIGQLVEGEPSNEWEEMQCWIETYACTLQHVGEVQLGRPGLPTVTPPFLPWWKPSWVWLGWRWNPQESLAAGLTHHIEYPGKAAKGLAWWWLTASMSWLSGSPHAKLWMNSHGQNHPHCLWVTMNWPTYRGV